MDILAAQQRLLSIGLGLGPAGADGIRGRTTNKAVRQFQGSAGLHVTGQLSHKTLGALFPRECNLDVPADRFPWYELAQAEMGTRELAGKRHNPKLIGAWRHVIVSLFLMAAILAVSLSPGCEARADGQCREPYPLAAALKNDPDVKDAQAIHVPSGKIGVVALFESGPTNISWQTEGCEYRVVFIPENYGRRLIKTFAAPEA